MKLKAKIIGAAACAFALCVALAGCAGAPAGNDAANFQGDWILTSGTVDGQEATEETLAQAQEMGLSVYLQLNEGGSAVLSVLGTNMDGSWTAKDATTVELTFDGSSAEATLEGEELVMQQDGDVMRFKRGEIPPGGQRGSARREPGSRARGLDDLLKRLSITTIVRSFASCGGPFCARDQRKGVLRNHLYTGKISYKMTFWLRKWYTVIVQRMGFFQQVGQGEFCRG